MKFVETGDLEHRNPKSVGKTWDFYIRTVNGTDTDDLEDFFGQQVEDQFALVSQKIKTADEQFSLSGKELGILARFVAAQAVRTEGHKACMEVQANGSLDTNRFTNEMLKVMRMVINHWENNPPSFHFFTPLPLIGAQFISGDHPIVVLLNNQNVIWEPIARPTSGITSVQTILSHPKYEFVVTLSPYICLSIQPGNGKTGVHMPLQECDVRHVRGINNLIRGQCRIFLFAKDKEYL